MNNKKDLSIKNEIGYQFVNKGGDKVAKSIADVIPKPTSVGGKIIFHLGAMLFGYGLTKLLKDDNGKLSESNRRFVSGAQRGLHRRI